MLVFNILSEIGSQVGTSYAMGDNVTFGTIVGSVAGGIMGGKLPNWRGTKGGWIKNALGEIGFNAAKGATRGFVSGAIGLTQLSMLSYRMSLPISSKIGTFSRFSSAYRGLGNVSRTLGESTRVMAPVVILNDYTAYKNNEIGLGRLGYRTGSLGSSIYIGTSIGGPTGAVAETAVGLVLTGLEFIYDNAFIPLWNETNRQIYNFEKAVSNGWHPRW